MSSIFSKIITGEIPSYKIAEDDHFLAFLDINPLVMGHVLVIPKKEIDYIFDIEDDLYADFALFAKKVAAGLKKAFPCKKVGVAVIGLEVSHAHIHLIPMNKVSDMNFAKEKLNPSPQQLAQAASKIKSEL